MKHRNREAMMSADERIAVIETTIVNINSNLADMRQDIKRLSDRMDNKFDIFHQEMQNQNSAVRLEIKAQSDQSDARLQEMKTQSDARLQEIKTQSDARLQEIKTQSDARLQEIKTQSDVRLLETKQETKANIDAFRQDMKDLRKDMNDGFSTINNRLWSNFLWLIGMMLGLAGLIARAVHWI